MISFYIHLLHRIGVCTVMDDLLLHIGIINRYLTVILKIFEDFTKTEVCLSLAPEKKKMKWAYYSPCSAHAYETER